MAWCTFPICLGRKVNHPSEVLKKGDEVDAIVLDVDTGNQRISLGMKQLAEDPWEDIDGRFRIGDVVMGVVSKTTSFGAFVELQDHIDGLVHISQISEDRSRKDQGCLECWRRGHRSRDKDRSRRTPHRPEHKGS